MRADFSTAAMYVSIPGAALRCTESLRGEQSGIGSGLTVTLGAHLHAVRYFVLKCDKMS